ncbi:uncharacterized protein LOC110981140 [Acanthaster planci]|uniref:Uncharacterized protein LOC110981140 n=1 Tax=Acanthaster planci TaxID=133434 RepID=A0A8B7YNU3_ACAPL|nr:uncharacterized protein LOC110981140 [Acanthaster planci]
MVQLAVYAANPEDHKEQFKKPSWPIGENADFVEVKIPKDKVSEVEVKPTGCCTRRCAVILVVLGVLIALGTVGAVLGVYYSTRHHEPQKDDVLYPTPIGRESGDSDDGHHDGHTGRPDCDHDHDDHHGDRPDPDDDHTGRPDCDHDPDHDDNGHHDRPRPAPTRPKPSGESPMRPWP